LGSPHAWFMAPDLHGHHLVHAAGGSPVGARPSREALEAVGLTGAWRRACSGLLALVFHGFFGADPSSRSFLSPRSKHIFYLQGRHSRTRASSRSRRAATAAAPHGPGPGRPFMTNGHNWWQASEGSNQLPFQVKSGDLWRLPGVLLSRRLCAVSRLRSLWDPRTIKEAAESKRCCFEPW